jgi:hypothetical protein
MFPIILSLTVLSVFVLLAAFGLHCLLCACDENRAKEKSGS